MTPFSLPDNETAEPRLASLSGGLFDSQIVSYIAPHAYDARFLHGFGTLRAANGQILRKVKFGVDNCHMVKNASNGRVERLFSAGWSKTARMGGEQVRRDPSSPRNKAQKAKNRTLIQISEHFRMSVPPLHRNRTISATSRTVESPIWVVFDHSIVQERMNRPDKTILTTRNSALPARPTNAIPTLF